MQLKHYLGMSLLALATATPLSIAAAPPDGSAEQMANQERAPALSGNLAQALAGAPLPAADTLAATPLQAAANELFEQPVALDQLDNLRGGADTVNNNATLSGVVTGNTAINVSTGSNIITGASFANSAGVPIVVQNSGANVLIQNSTIINLQLQ